MDQAIRNAERALAVNPDDVGARSALRAALARAGLTEYVVHYSSNNSGGSWWLNSDDWAALARGGWKIDDHRSVVGNVPTSATKVVRASDEGAALANAIADWAALTALDPDVEGCACCGQPHYFYAMEAGD